MLWKNDNKKENFYHLFPKFLWAKKDIILKFYKL